MMSARRQLWGDLASLIHLENACIQLRKVCEGTAHLALIAGEIEFGDLPKKLRKRHRVGEILKHLDRIDRLKFPFRAQIAPKGRKGDATVWDLKLLDSDMRSDLDRVVAIWNRIGNLLHERSAFKEWHEQRNEAVRSLSRDLNGVRADHQFLWNYLWQHALCLSECEVFFLNLGDAQKPSCPLIATMEGFLTRDLAIEFEPDYFADFDGEIDWTLFDQNEQADTRNES